LFKLFIHFYFFRLFMKQFASWSQCYKTLIYWHSTVMPLFCVIKQYYDSNYREMAASNTMVIYCGISTLETTGIFIKLAVNYYSI
jgi:hypothetical protein